MLFSSVANRPFRQFVIEHLEFYKKLVHNKITSESSSEELVARGVAIIESCGRIVGRLEEITMAELTITMHCLRTDVEAICK